MKSIVSLLAASVIYLPFEKSMWKETSFPFKSEPKYTFTKKHIRIDSKKDLGGYAFLLKRPIAIEKETKLDLSWEIKKHIKATPSHPVKKSIDDAAIRVGLIITGGKIQAKIPSAVRSKLPDFREPISDVIFYSAINGTGEMSCGDSPHNIHTVYCLVPSVNKSRFISFPYLDIHKQKPSRASDSMKIVGFWIFADTDDTKSSSQAILNHIKVEVPEKTSKIDKIKSQ